LTSPDKGDAQLPDEGDDEEDASLPDEGDVPLPEHDISSSESLSE
jgi:hypothetical protein